MGVPVWRRGDHRRADDDPVLLLWAPMRLARSERPPWASARSSTWSGRRDGSCDGSCDGWDRFWPLPGHRDERVPVLVPGPVPDLLRRGSLSQVLSGKKRRAPVLVPVLVPVVVPVRLRMTTGKGRRGRASPGGREELMMDSAIDETGVALLAGGPDQLTPPMALGRRRARDRGRPSPGVRRGFLIPQPGGGGIGERPGPIPHLVLGLGKRPLNRDAICPRRRSGWNREAVPSVSGPGRNFYLGKVFGNWLGKVAAHDPAMARPWGRLWGTPRVGSLPWTGTLAGVVQGRASRRRPQVAEWPLTTPGRPELTMDMAGRSPTGRRSCRLVSPIASTRPSGAGAAL